jgi:hypothetical protein
MSPDPRQALRCLGEQQSQIGPVIAVQPLSVGGAGRWRATSGRDSGDFSPAWLYACKTDWQFFEIGPVWVPKRDSNSLFNRLTATSPGCLLSSRARQFSKNG